MAIDLILWSRDEFSLSELQNVDEFIDSDLLFDSEGYLSLECGIFDSIENAILSFKYLFGEIEDFDQIYQDNQTQIIDLTAIKSNITTFEKLEEWYSDWINESKRENSMDEYGQFIGLIGYVNRKQQKKHLFAIIKEF